MSNSKQHKNYFDIAIIGGGPAGLSAAITSAKFSRMKNKNFRIAIFESENKLGKTILKTGNGRCNFSNYYINENKAENYYHERFCNKVFDSCEKIVNAENIFEKNLQNDDVSPALQMFEYLGLACYCDEDGKMFPYTNKATSVVDVLNYEILEQGIKVFNNEKFINYKFDSKSKDFILNFESGKSFNAKKIIFTVGSEKLTKKLFKDSFIEYKKLLGPIKTSEKFIKNLDGIKARVRCSICDKNNKEYISEIGEILFRKYGVSGICVFNLSRFLNSKTKQKIIIDFAPEDSLEDLRAVVKNRYKLITKKTNKEVDAKRLFAGMLLPEIVQNICDYSKVNSNNVRTSDIDKICRSIKHFDLDVKDIGDEKQCQICRGGISVEDIDAKTMEYRKSKNIYFAGEVVDVDGPCGGYNLHWAWTSGILAGAFSINSLLSLKILSPFPEWFLV